MIERCNLFDPESGKMLPEQTIVIRGTQIVRVVGADEIGDVPADATRIDGRGRFALPGLIDAHVHVVHVLDYAHVTGDEVLPLYLAAGVTSIRSTGDEVVAATLVARLAAAHPERSPRVFTCSPLLDADPPIHRDIGQAVTDPAKVAAVFDDLAQWNIRRSRSMPARRPVGKAIIEECHRRGLFVTATGPLLGAGRRGRQHRRPRAHLVGLQLRHPPRSQRSRGIAAARPGTRSANRWWPNWPDARFSSILHWQSSQHAPAPDVPEVHDHPTMPWCATAAEFWPVYLKRSGCPQVDRWTIAAASCVSGTDGQAYRAVCRCSREPTRPSRRSPRASHCIRNWRCWSNRDCRLLPRCVPPR